MSSHHITVAQLIEKLKQFPPQMLVAVPSPCSSDEVYEGVIDGPRYFDMIGVQDVRTGFNPVCPHWPDQNWPVLLIRSDNTRVHWPINNDKKADAVEEMFSVKGKDPHMRSKLAPWNGSWENDW